MMNESQMSSGYVDEQRKSYALYVIQMRAIPHLADGLKASARRVLWTARSGDKFKCATLAGATMPIHPHAAPEGVINTLAGPYTNNIPLFTGIGAFGTLLNPSGYGASRYTSVKVSKFTQDVIFADIELVPMVDNYDLTLREPKHFLPLVPISLVNPSEGIALGFACNILPYNINDIIKSQIHFLTGKLRHYAVPYFKPLDSHGKVFEDKKSEYKRWKFTGKFETVNTNTIIVTQLPYDKSHSKFIAHLNALLEKEQVIDYVDNSSNVIHITVKFRRRSIDTSNIATITKLLKLEANHSEILNMIDTDGKTIITTDYNNTVERFTSWRLDWYKTRYERLLRLLEVDIQRYNDILRAIKKKVGSIAIKTKNKEELIEYLDYIKIVHLEYIASLPVYRFTEDEREKIEVKLHEALKVEREYINLIKNKDARVEVYVSELKDVLRTYKS